MKNIIENLPIIGDIIKKIESDKIIYLSDHILPIDTKNLYFCFNFLYFF